MNLEQKSIKKTKKLCAENKIEVFYLTDNGPIRENDPDKKLACFFSPQKLYAALSIKPTKLAIKFKKPSEIKVSDLKPVLDKLEKGSKIGIQVANPSLSKFIDLEKYKKKNETIKNKLQNNQHLNEIEQKIQHAFLNTGLLKIPRLDFALYYCDTINKMSDIALLLAKTASKNEIQPILSVCLDNNLINDNIKLAEKISFNPKTFGREYEKKLQIFKKQMLEKTGHIIETIIYNESELNSMPCACGFCGGKICPSKASDAVQKFINLGCTTVINFYIEDDHHSFKTDSHFTRIERGMLHRTVILNDHALICNIYFGQERAFIVIHKPL